MGKKPIKAEETKKRNFDLKGAASGLYDFVCFVGLGAIIYVLYFEGDLALKYLSAVTGVKFIEIAFKRFLK